MSAHSYGDRLNKKGLTVPVRLANNENEAKSNLEKAIKALKRRVSSEGLVKDLRQNEYHETKGQIRRKKRNEAVRRNKKLKKDI
ncbi:hypothetical protein FDI40_gp713 [Agrobacterium phage Atu_ph07]|uniref:30S ribosomal protein S21 n=1 Tax=Agrobacterium phage Atu_ph07 TaxID=2024264 RepID=A0A2L0V0V4_9CAUD|nr:hypothetical protein FDI40_gp713 [Agrobacterium phage Atu_ph07]AUZ95452.1 hypothetical protein [Agrobacterium phage Atu_ph07]